MIKQIFSKYNNYDMIELYYNTNNKDYILIINGKKKIIKKEVVK